MPDLLVLDLTVPGRTGHELLAERAGHNRLAAAHRGRRDVLRGPADRDRSLALGAALHVGKPVDADGFARLADRLASLIS